MNFLRKALLPLAGVIALALIVMIASPRAAHALAVALVQVANTPNTAVPIVQAPASNQIATGRCQEYIPSSWSGSVTCSGPGVPAEKTLVIETVTVEADTTTGYPPVTVTLAGDETSPRVHVPVIQQGSMYGGLDHYVGTLVGARLYLPAGQVPGCTVVFWDSNGNGASFRCDWSGYYVPSH
jgi:hypothetical protein